MSRLKLNSRPTVWAFLVICLASAVVVGIERQGRAADPAGNGRTEARRVTDIDLQGQLRPSKQVTLALSIAGVIAERTAEVGQRVRQGDLLARLDSELEEAALAIAKLKASSTHQVAAARLTMDQKAHDLERVKELQKKNAATAWELRQAELEVELAKVRMDYAKFQQDLEIQEARQAEVALKRRRLLAPWDGVISRTYKEAGEAVQEQAPVCELVNLDSLWVELNVLGDYYGQIVPGLKATVTMGSQVREARVLRVDPQVDRASNTFGVILEMDNKDNAFVAGRPATVRLGASRE
ncbi:MAG: hypothetical protein BIFFINMI_03162 [Phycisphaerae bacterium]|nr:hypothetical protein [Phycisphaerae bacterium]